MSEELKPCPACGNPDVMVRIDTKVAVYCSMCGMCGPCAPIQDEDYVIRQWNALPRALEWTDEPPKVPGDYWLRYKSAGKTAWSPTHIVPILGALNNCSVPEEWTAVEWAGPIPEPREPK